MLFFRNEYYEPLRRVVTSGSRYRLSVVGVNYLIEDAKILDAGKEIAPAVERISKGYGKRESELQMEIAEAVENTVRQYIFEDEELGSMVVIENLGILFEPELHIDVVGMLKRISKNTLTVLLWPGKMDETGLYFLEKGSKYVIKQTDINYTII